MGGSHCLVKSWLPGENVSFIIEVLVEFIIQFFVELFVEVGAHRVRSNSPRLIRSLPSLSTC